MLRQCGIFFTFLLAAAFAGAMEIPSESKVLGVSKGRSFNSGLVFVNGKYLPPPYVVERWGCGIRINKVPVIGEVVPWNSFVKTQKSAAKPVRQPEPAATPAPAPVPAPAPAAKPADTLSLDDLFDDDPPPAPAAKPVAASVPVETAAPKAEPAPKAPLLDGPFVPNDASRALVKRINEVRTQLNVVLLSGGFICFGDAYSRISGDANTTRRILARLPELMRRAESAEAFVSSVRSAGLVYLTEPVCRDLYQNRVDYRQLKERRDRERRAAADEQFLKDASKPLL